MASASPRRKELLKPLLGEFEIIPSLADESGVVGSPDFLVRELAKRKALEVALRDDCFGKIVLGSDTVVALGDEILGKPKNEGDARRMLTALSGRVHDVYTGVCMARTTKEGVKTLVDFARTRVRFYSLADAFIDGYIASGSPMDKAGAYGIQDGGLVEKIEGSYSCVVGLPQELVGQMIEKVKREWV